ncbi:MAG: hypothetical protein LBB61_09510 [Treponema sp.]|jgi:hypothetical protein|nr:hypothetical protein [Treponema sp.]
MTFVMKMKEAAAANGGNQRQTPRRAIIPRRPAYDGNQRQAPAHAIPPRAPANGGNQCQAPRRAIPPRRPAYGGNQHQAPAEGGVSAADTRALPARGQKKSREERGIFAVAEIRRGALP